MKKNPKKIRYAVVGLGHIAQTAVLPAFRHAKNSELTALVSGDPVKLKKLGRKYKVKTLCSYDDYEALLSSNAIDAVYIATPNFNHRELTEIALANGVHVLCEKPMALTEVDCEAMIREAERNRVKLMIAYRLHFEAANIKAIEIAKSGRLGEIKIFNSVFTMQVRDRNNIRLDYEMGGGPLYDIGIYCINAARSLFQAEPISVMATGITSDDSRFREVDEMVSAILTFPHNRIANFTCSFGAADRSDFDLVGTKGSLRLECGYDYAEPMKLIVTKGDDVRRQTFPKRDQFGPELVYFSDCILNNHQPEPSGREGLADIRVIEAIFESMGTGAVVHLGEVDRAFKKTARPKKAQVITRPGLNQPRLVHVTEPG